MKTYSPAVAALATSCEELHPSQEKSTEASKSAMDSF
jgi:hypothetical protein